MAYSASSDFSCMLAKRGHMGFDRQRTNRDLERIGTLLTQLQYSRIEAQDLINDELRRLITDALTGAIGALRRGHDEVCLVHLRSLLSHEDSLDSGVAL